MSNPEFYAFVRCHGDSVPGHCCGLVGITHDEYRQQMSSPDSLWNCPHCGSTASYQDHLSDPIQEAWDWEEEEEARA